jgi:hypothetical protein
LTKFANIFLNFTKFSISKSWKKKTQVGDLRRAVKPELVQLKEGNCFCDHGLAWRVTNSMRFFFVSNTFSIPELESSFFTPASPSSASCNYSLRKENWVWTQIDNWVFILNSCNPQEVVLY